MRTFELRDGKSMKFWHVAVHGPSHTVQYGRIGSAGRSITKDFDSPESADRDAQKQIAAKLKKGYAETTTDRSIDFEPIYLVSNKTVPVAPADVDELKEAIGSLPLGYREFVHRCGERGFLCDDITIWPPRAILERVDAEREYMTFSHCVGTVKDRKGLTKADFPNIWVFGGDGLGNNYCYFPRHEGVLFNILHEGTRVVRHNRAFCDVGRFFYYERVRHPFPFFTPMDNRTVKRPRTVNNFRFETSLQTMEVAQMIVEYWREQGEEGKLVRLPSQHPGDDSDDVLIFVKSLGAEFSLGRDAYNHPGQVLGCVHSEKEHRFAARKCLKALEKAVLKR